MLRELPVQIEAAASQVAAAEAQVAESRRGQEAVQASLNAARSQRDQLIASQQKQAAEVGRVQLAAERARQTRAFHVTQRQQIAKELTELNRREGELKVAAVALAEQAQAQETRLAAARREIGRVVHR